MVILEPEEFQRWRDNPLTVEFLGLLKLRRQHLMEAWARGQSLTPEEQAQAVLLGKLSEVRRENLMELAGIEPDDPPQD